MIWFCVKYQKALTLLEMDQHHCLEKRYKVRHSPWGKSRGKRCPKLIRL